MTELKSRKQIPSKFKWNLNAAFPSDETWEKSFDNFALSLKKIEIFKGKLGDCAKSLLSCLKTRDELEIELYRLYAYAHLSLHGDMTDSKYQGMASRAVSLGKDYGETVSFIEPEIISLGRMKVNAFIEDDGGSCCDRDSLGIYRHYFDNLFRKQNHILSPDEEKFLAKAGEIGNGFSRIFDMINNADIAFAKAFDSNGEEHEITHGRYGLLMQSDDRILRENTYKNKYDAFVAQKNTIAETYSNAVKYSMLEASARNYSSTLEASLADSNIPTEIYANLIDTVNDNLHLYHRYLELRKKSLGYDKLHTWDIAAPFTENPEIKISWDDAKTTVIDGMAALGEECQAIIRKGFEEGWVDVYENKGKRSGAYCWGVYGFPHPYVLMNYNGTVNNMFTLSHEMGHALHFHYAFNNQPAIYGGSTYFLMEIASNVNEALLLHHLLSTATDKSMLKYLTNYYIQKFERTFFRQTMLAEFEMKAHQAAENGSPLTSELLSGLYRNISEKHYGPVVIRDERADYAWSRIPHFYRIFYVYQYATGFAASMALAKKILDEGAPAVRKYLNLLKSGNSDYSINLLKEAGVDMASPQPIRDALEVFEGLLDRFEGMV